jgi:hypothetical protein
VVARASGAPADPPFVRTNRVWTAEAALGVPIRATPDGRTRTADRHHVCPSDLPHAGNGARRSSRPTPGQWWTAPPIIPLWTDRDALGQSAGPCRTNNSHPPTRSLPPFAAEKSHPSR